MVKATKSSSSQFRVGKKIAGVKGDAPPFPRTEQNCRICKEEARDEPRISLPACGNRGRTNSLPDFSSEGSTRSEWNHLAKEARGHLECGIIGGRREGVATTGNGDKGRSFFFAMASMRQWRKN